MKVGRGEQVSLQVGVISLFPELIQAVLDIGVVGRAIESNRLLLRTYQIRDHATGPHQQVDDHVYGGGPGMLMLAEPLTRCVQKVRTDLPEAKVIALSSQGERLTQDLASELAHSDQLILVCGRYEGMDERFIKRCVDREISIGDYVLTGGELPALVLLDSVTRLLEGALGNEKSAEQDSFRDNLLEGPQFTRPKDWEGRQVPEVLLSGDHAKIEAWNREQALRRTWERRPDLLLRHTFSEYEKNWLKRYLQETSLGKNDER